MSVFKSDKTWNKFYDILISWEGTPYRHMQRTKGRGADCTLFAGQSLVELGVLSDLEYEYYSKDWFMHTEQEVILEYLLQHINNNLMDGYCFVSLPLSVELNRGDYVSFSTGPKTVTNHMCIMLNDIDFIHCITKRGVERTGMLNYYKLHKNWKSAITHIFRLETK